MRETDIAIVGGGLAGSTAAAMLGRAGHDVVLVDPHASYPKDFRCEKLDTSQVDLLQKTGLAEALARASTIDLEVWIARLGRVVERKPSGQYDILYDAMVNTLRAQIPASVPFQRLTLSTGEENHFSQFRKSLSFRRLRTAADCGKSTGRASCGPI